MQHTPTTTIDWIAAGALPVSLAHAGPLAATGNQQSCTVHDPIRILEDHGPLGFTWDDPITGETTYRPGSGVVAGDGTASTRPENPPSGPTQRTLLEAYSGYSS